MNPSGRLAQLADPEATAQRLAAAGLAAASAADKARLLARCAAALARPGADEQADALAFFVPGRIEVLGKHTDYAGGRTVVATPSKGICLVAVPRGDAGVHAAALDLDDRCEFEISTELAPAVGHWSNYLASVARRLARNFPGTWRGAEIAFAGDLPVAAGMSSSSAVVVACSLALMAINDLTAREEYAANIGGPEDLAGYLATMENGQSFGSLAGDKGVGTFGGSEDHTAMLCSQPGRLSQYAYCPVRLQRRIDLPAGYVFAVAASGVVAEKTGEAMAKYNLASARAAAVAEAWRDATGRDDPHLAAALASDDLDRAAERVRAALWDRGDRGTFSAKELVTRFEHFLAENEEIIPPAGDALAAGDVVRFGQFVDRSQELADSLLGNQVPETIHLAASARELGAPAATGMGAGFGGSVWALVREADADELLSAWAGRYAEAFPKAAKRACFFRTRPGPAAFQVAREG